jgi:uncharacterized protein YcaQ
MSVDRISLHHARRLAIRAQLLDGRVALPEVKQGVVQAIEHLGYVQIDTISVVERAHHHTLWTRQPDYDPEMLHDLQAADRRVFEYWAHAMSFLPISDYRFYIPRMTRVRRSGRKWLKDWRAKHQHVLRDVLARIEQEGPLTSKDFEPPPGTKRGTWWDWKPAKTALEVLLWQGDLMVTERRSFQKVYDLTERVLPSGVDTSIPSARELGRFHVTRALSSLAVASSRQIADLFRVVDKASIDTELADLVRAGEVVEVSVDGRYGLYALPGTLGPVGSDDARVALLSPFDNLIIQRERTKWLFDFDYTLECYVPAAKRVHGYFVFPVLFDGALVGRLDPKADRKEKTLIVQTLHFEPTFERFDDCLPALADALARFARFNGCETVSFGTIRPTGLKRSLKSLVARALAREG